MKTKIDKTIIGAVLGLVLPIVTLLIFMYFKFDGTLGEFISYLAASKGNRNDPLILAMIPNMVLFYFSNFQFKWHQFTVGLVGVTLLYTIPLVISLI
jgi:hypothetical protein